MSHNKLESLNSLKSIQRVVFQKCKNDHVNINSFLAVNGTQIGMVF